jgi:hypothetical protein
MSSGTPPSCDSKSTRDCAANASTPSILGRMPNSTPVATRRGQSASSSQTTASTSWV